MIKLTSLLLALLLLAGCTIKQPDGKVTQFPGPQLAAGDEFARPPSK